MNGHIRHIEEKVNDLLEQQQAMNSLVEELVGHRMTVLLDVTLQNQAKLTYQSNTTDRKMYEILHFLQQYCLIIDYSLNKLIKK